MWEIIVYGAAYAYGATGWGLVFDDDDIPVITGPNGERVRMSRRFDLYTALDIAEVYILSHGLAHTA